MRRIAFAVAGVVGLVAVLAGCTIPLAAPVAERANESLTVVGSVKGAYPRSRGTITVSGQTPVTIEPITGYPQTEAVAVNDAGLVVGSYELPIKTGPEIYAAFVWTEAGGPVVLPAVPGGAVSVQAVDINENGVVLLSVRKVSGSYDSVPYLYDTATGAYTALSTIAGASAEARGLNDAGVVVGSILDGGSPRAARWTTPTTPAFLPGTAGQWSFAVAVNNLGTIVGYSLPTAIWWDAATSTRHDLGTAMPSAINESNVAVGNTSELTGNLSGVVVPPQDALRWDLLAGTTTLLAPGKTDTFVSDITDGGVAVGRVEGPGPDGVDTAVRFT